MKQESLWSAIKAGFPVGAVFFGALVGPVMVTGSYTMNYFLCAGVKSCITGSKIDPKKMKQHIEENMIPVFPLGVFKDIYK